MESMQATEERELVYTRVIHAPRAVVYRCWTEPELLVQWFTPAPWTTARAELDVRPGGTCHIVMRSPEGEEVPNPGVYLEVVPGEKLVFTDAYTSAWEPSEKPFMTGEIALSVVAEIVAESYGRPGGPMRG